MRISVDPVPAYKRKMEDRVNVFFAANAQNIAHFQKRQMALAVVGGAEAAPEFIQAAEIEGMDVQEYATLVVSKPDDMMAAENKRRRIVLAIRASTTTQEIDDLLISEGLEPKLGEALPFR